MLGRIPKLLLLAALLAVFAVSSTTAFGSDVCECFNPCFFCPKDSTNGGCHFDQKTSQCVNTSCDGFCLQIVP